MQLIEQQYFSLFLLWKNFSALDGRTLVKTFNNPTLIETVEKIVENSTYGNPETLITYTNLSLRDISDILEKDYKIKASRNVVSDILEILGYSKQQNRKLEQVGNDHIDRDDQFKYINATAEAYLKAGEPVISIDCKKKRASW